MIIVPSNVGGVAPLTYLGSVPDASATTWSDGNTATMHIPVVNSSGSRVYTASWIRNIGTKISVVNTSAFSYTTTSTLGFDWPGNPSDMIAVPNTSGWGGGQRLFMVYGGVFQPTRVFVSDFPDDSGGLTIYTIAAGNSTTGSNGFGYRANGDCIARPGGSNPQYIYFAAPNITTGLDADNFTLSRISNQYTPGGESRTIPLAGSQPIGLGSSSFGPVLINNTNTLLYIVGSGSSHPSSPNTGSITVYDITNWSSSAASFRPALVALGLSSSLGANQGAPSAAMSPDRSKIYYATRQQIGFFNTSNNTASSPVTYCNITNGSSPYLTVSPDGSEILLSYYRFDTNPYEMGFFVLDSSSLTVKYSIPTPSFNSGSYLMRFSGDGKRVYFAASDANGERKLGVLSR